MMKIANCHDPSNTPGLRQSDIFQLCRSARWNQVQECVRRDPLVAMTLLIMDNNISTTILHQAISSKSDTQARAAVMRNVLDLSPKAVTIRNGYGSLPIHVICQRNTKMDSQTKESLIMAMIKAYPESLLEAGGVGGRTPLHIVFTDYVSPQLIRFMIDTGRKACFMRDKKGWLPVHMACSRHCSPEKLRMLLDEYPKSLHSKTPDGQSLLCLATSKATKSHPNYALISELKELLKSYKDDDDDTEEMLCASPGHDMPRHMVTPDVKPIDPRMQPQKKSEVASLDDAPADLLLHFHRTGNQQEEENEGFDGQYAEV
jgi:hypothetical protein